MRKIPDPFNIIMLKHKRDNSYSCWNYRTNSQVFLLFDKFGVPFDTKLGQLLKAEYTHAELFTKQNSAHLSDGYILSELKDDPEDACDDDDIAKEYKQALMAQRDKDDDEQWKRQLGSFDDEVKYEDTNGGHPARIVIRGVARPPRLPYLGRGGGGGGGGKGVGGVGGKGKGGSSGDKSDPASDLVKMLQKQITTGERAAQDISKMLKSTVTDENSYLKGASKKLEDILSSKHEFIAKIHKNLDAVTKEIDDITTDERPSSSSDDGFGVIPIRKMISGIATSMATVHDMVEKLEASLTSVGINPAAVSETDMFREMDTRIGALTSTANHKTCMEMRMVMESVETMMDHMETVVNSHTSSLTVPASTHERMCVDDLAFDMENFDDDFANVLKGPGEVAPFTSSSSGGDAAASARASELYAEYYSKMKEANDMYKTLKSNYTGLVKNFQSFQVNTLKDVSKIAEYKSKTVDARNLVMIYKKFLNAQVKMNKEGMIKIEGVLQDLEGKVKEVSHARHRDNAANMENLKQIQGDLQAILASADVDEPSDYLEDTVLRSDEVLTDLRARRVDDLTRVSDAFRDNLEELRRTFPMMEESRDRRKRKLQDDLEGGGGDGGGGGSGSSSSSGGTTVVDVPPGKDAQSNHNEVNTRIGTSYGSAMDKYHDMVDSLGEEREKAIGEAKIKDLERRERVQKAKVNRESAIEEHNHVMSMKRYGDILTGREEAKRRKKCGGTHDAEAMTIGKLRPMPQMLVVKDHFRKANIMPNVPEKHMSDSRKMLRARWEDFVNNQFPPITIVDNHGVKMWGVNEEAVADTMVIPFMKVRYGLKCPGRVSTGMSSNPIASVRYAFNTMCDEFATELLLHSANDEYRQLMPAFNPNLGGDRPSKLRDYDGRGGGGGGGGSRGGGGGGGDPPRRGDGS
jgi:uncharacterized membrane protein YgcG